MKYFEELKNKGFEIKFRKECDIFIYRYEIEYESELLC